MQIIFFESGKEADPALFSIDESNPPDPGTTIEYTDPRHGGKARTGTYKVQSAKMFVQRRVRERDTDQAFYAVFITKE